MTYLKLICLLTATALAQTIYAEDEFQSLFNGKDLSGWDGNPALWTVEDGCITGKTQGPETLTYNQFLIWRGGVLKNFELRAKVKQRGKNTGIQYRSQELPKIGKWSIKGYQCDIHPEEANNGMLYEEKGRGIMAQNGQHIIADPKGSRWLISSHESVTANVEEWHEYTIIAVGNRLIHKIDGKTTIDVIDCDEKSRSLEGLLAFQIHQGPAMTVQIKEVLYKKLPDSDPQEFDPSVIPADSKPLGKVRPGKNQKAAQ